jgi:sarcosine oxidase subunit alpha
MDGSAPLPVGAHVVASGEHGAESHGYVTSAGFSDVLGRGVAIGMLRGGRPRVGEPVTIRTLEGDRLARVTAPAAYDPEGTRLRG